MRTTKIANTEVSFDEYKVLSAYRVDSGCQFLGWVARCEYVQGGMEWMARTRDGATSTIALKTKEEAAKLLDTAYDVFCAFDVRDNGHYNSDSKLNPKVA